LPLQKTWPGHLPDGWQDTNATASLYTFWRNQILSSPIWQRLLRQTKAPEYLWAVWVFGIVAGILVPVILVMVGWLIQLLLVGQHGLSVGGPHEMPLRLDVGAWFSMPTSWLNAGGSILRGVLGIIVLLVIVIALESIALITCYRSALHASLDIAVEVQRKLFEKSNALAIEQGLSGQQEAMRDMMFVHIPQMREAASLWYKVFPRHLVQSSLLLILAGSIQPWVTALATISALVLWALFSNLDIARRKRRPVLFERVRTASEQLTYLCETSPLLASVRDQEDTKQSFEGQLNAYRQSQLQLSDGGIWRSPVMLLTATLLAALLMIVISIRFLDVSSRLHFGEITVLCAAVGFAIMGVHRSSRAFRRYKSTENAVEQLVKYLEQPTLIRNESEPSESIKALPQISLEHVTIRNSSGQKLLEDVSATCRAGQLTAIVASESVQANALAELILGFGRPVSGRILIGESDSTDIDPNSLRKTSLWVAAKGPLVQGSLEENLWAGAAHDATIDLMSFARRMNVSDAILNLPDGLQTLVSPDEDRIQPDHLFRLGLTRGLIKKPKLVVAQEPTVKVKATTEADTLEALMQIRAGNAILVVLPQRLATLRAADQIIIVHEHRVVGTGTHAELLEQSDIYRHLNYIQFSPFNDARTA
jgi:ATP-binding cassette subfamily B protein